MAHKTHFSRSGGNQWGESFYHFGHPTGNVLYVHSGGSSTGPGFTPETAYSTIDAAVSACTADNGDVVVVLPGHTETITGAAGIALDVAGVKVLGVGEGRRRPRVTFSTNNAASFDVSAARCVVDNLVLINGKDGQTAMVNVSAADVVIQNCEIQTGNASTQAALGILTTASADRMVLSKNHIHGTADAGTATQVSLVGGDFIVIEDNVIVGACSTTGNIANATTDSTNLMILRNYLLNQTADGNNKVIVLTASTTGLIANNRFAVIDSMSPAPVTAAGAYVSGNYTTGGAGVTASTLM